MSNTTETAAPAETAGVPSTEVKKKNLGTRTTDLKSLEPKSFEELELV